MTMTVPAGAIKARPVKPLAEVNLDAALAKLATPPRELRGRHAHAPTTMSAAVRRRYNRAGSAW